MRNNLLKRFIRDKFFPNGAVRHIAFGPLRGFSYRVSPLTGIETWHSAHERPLQNAFTRLVRAGDVVVDVGTNWGGHALHLSLLVGHAGKVIAIEPSPSVVLEAKWHIEANQRTNITLIETALSDHEGREKFEDGSGTTGHLAETVQSRTDYVEVPVTTLDRVVCQQCLSSLKLVKIDVEGAESRVLSGAEETLTRLRPIFVIELHTPEQDVKVAEILRRFGYTIRRLNGAPVLHADRGWPDKDGVWGIILATPD